MSNDRINKNKADLTGHHLILGVTQDDLPEIKTFLRDVLESNAPDIPQELKTVMIEDAYQSIETATKNKLACLTTEDNTITAIGIWQIPITENNADDIKFILEEAPQEATAGMMFFVDPIHHIGVNGDLNQMASRIMQQAYKTAKSIKAAETQHIIENDTGEIIARTRKPF